MLTRIQRFQSRIVTKNIMPCAGEIVRIGLFPAGCNARRKLRGVVILTQAICNAAVRPPGAIQPDNFPRARHKSVGWVKRSRTHPTDSGSGCTDVSHCGSFPACPKPATQSPEPCPPPHSQRLGKTRLGVRRLLEIGVEGHRDVAQKYPPGVGDGDFFRSQRD